jgi:protein-S-isoprenylcysteine O-methyltransferase Ste14
MKRAATGSTLFFALAPGTVAGVVPFLVTSYEANPVPRALQLAGVILTALAATVLVHAFARFVKEGLGTPAPVAPTEFLVRGGLYRYVRNPMYLAVVSAVVGQAAIFGSTALLVYAAILQLTFVAFVRGYEEPTLHQQFGAQYDAYRQAVPGWWPRRLSSRGE